MSDGFQPTEPLDPSASPVAWVSNDVWARRHQWSRFPLLRAPNEGPGLLDAEPAVVDESFRQARPVNAPQHRRVPVMSLDEARAALARTEAVGAFWNPVDWPTCCEALAVLVLANPTSRELAAAEVTLGALDDACPIDHGWSDELAAIRAGGQPENGVNVFQCSWCGRSYGVHSHT